jgi:hypothetical protein
MTVVPSASAVNGKKVVFKKRGCYNAATFDRMPESSA